MDPKIRHFMNEEEFMSPEEMVFKKKNQQERRAEKVMRDALDRHRQFAMGVDQGWELLDVHPSRLMARDLALQTALYQYLNLKPKWRTPAQKEDEAEEDEGVTEEAQPPPKEKKPARRPFEGWKQLDELTEEANALGPDDE